MSASKPYELPDSPDKITSQEEGLNVLITFAQIGNRRGAWTLAESALMFKAIQQFVNPPAKLPPIREADEKIVEI
jgi:hypothetical protein